MQWKSPFDSCPATTCPVPLTNLQQPLSSRGMFRTPFSQLFHPDLRHGAIHLNNITNSAVERAKSVIDNEGKSVTVTS